MLKRLPCQQKEVSSPPARNASGALSSQSDNKKDGTRESAEVLSGTEGISPQQQNAPGAQESLRGVSDKARPDSAASSIQSQGSSATRDSGRIESRLMGWKGRLTKSTDGGIERSTSGSVQREADHRRLNMEEMKRSVPEMVAEPSPKDASAMNFTERMSSMFAAASNTLRPTSAKREEQRG